jgi:hypothetical protein
MSLATDTRAVADAMTSLAGYAGNINALAYLADVGPTTLMAALQVLGDDHADLARIADSVDNARELLGNQLGLAAIAADAPAVYAAADALDAAEAEGGTRTRATGGETAEYHRRHRPR